MDASGRIYIGIGGWTFPPWRGVFYPPGLPHARELRYAAERLTSIEINGTFYRTQTPVSFRKWASETPDGFVFSVKGPRYVTQRRDWSDAAASVTRFLESGVLELGDRLGPILWQFAPTKKFEQDAFARFLDILPRAYGDVPLRHAVEVRHDSFKDPAFILALRHRGIAVVYAEHATYPEMADVTSDFVYARLQKGRDRIETGYSAEALDAWADRLLTWAAGGIPADLPRIDAAPAAPSQSRDVFAFAIHEGKVRAPAAAMALIKRIATKQAFRDDRRSPAAFHDRL